MKMLLDNTLLDGGVSFREIEMPGSCIDLAWLVKVDGDTRTITQEGPGNYIAHIGHMDRHWCFDHALKACIEDARHQRDMHDRAEALRLQQAARFDRLTPEQFARVLEAREQELAGLSVNSPGRADMLRDEIALMKGTY
jgi:hypothetical protein